MGSQGSLLYLYPTTLDFDSLKPSKLSLFVRKERDNGIITGTQIYSATPTSLADKALS